MDPKAHWERVYETHEPDQVSWFQAQAHLSLALIEQAAPNRASTIIDVGAGASMLVDGRLSAGYRHVTVLDISDAALETTRRRLAGRSDTVIWRQADLLSADLPTASFDIWHDRAVFHFLTDTAERDQYLSQVRRALRPGGYALVATFAEDGPTRCSGLDVARYSADALHAVFGSDFRLVTSRRQIHRTPRGARQAFTYCLCRYEPSAYSRHAAYRSLKQSSDLRSAHFARFI